MIQTEWLEGIERAYDSFKSSKDLEKGILSSTKAGWGGAFYAVELFPKGNYRILSSHQIGNKYDSPGKILHIPSLEDEEYDNNSEADSFYDNAIEALDEKFMQFKIDLNHEGLILESL